MGDRAGTVGYLAKVPVVQLEGLVMDADYLKNIRAERNVKDVLHDYHVRYYISTDSVMDGAGCYSVREPEMAGPGSFVMRSVFCQQPVAIFDHRGRVNRIFDLQ